MECLKKKVFVTAVPFIINHISHELTKILVNYVFGECEGDYTYNKYIGHMHTKYFLLYKCISLKSFIINQCFTVFFVVFSLPKYVNDTMKKMEFKKFQLNNLT